jgi:Na+-transporting methylmalonyl-CoA/oxaloacetate decarboxylase gamma subunit
MDVKSAFVISGAGYGINILVMIMLSVLVWVVSLFAKRVEKTK